jgi:hypothetical protein
MRMDAPSILTSLESSGIATTIRDSLYLFPFFESAHVVGLALVFGTIAVLDFRMLGWGWSHRPFQRVTADVLKWTWLAFGLTLTTGALMFITNATRYYSNTAFRTKMLLLLLAGINMAVFELTAGRRVREWGHSRSAPTAGKAAAALSLVLWISIIFFGRWIGFTTTRTTEEANPAEMNFDDLFNSPPPEENSPAPSPEGK